MNHTRQQGSERFHSLLKEIADLHDKKQQDYGRQGDPFANVRASEDYGISPWVGALIRENDKMRRLQKAASGGILVNESVRDSLIDNAVYAIIALALWDEENEVVIPDASPHPTYGPGAIIVDDLPEPMFHKGDIYAAGPSPKEAEAWLQAEAAARVDR